MTKQTCSVLCKKFMCVIKLSNIEVVKRCNESLDCRTIMATA